MTDLGRDVFIGSFSVIAGLEGYLLTMAYRYVGDAQDVDIKARQSSSRTLSLLGVLVVNPISMIVSSLELEVLSFVQVCETPRMHARFHLKVIWSLSRYTSANTVK